MNLAGDISVIAGSDPVLAYRLQPQDVLGLSLLQKVRAFASNDPSWERVDPMFVRQPTSNLEDLELIRK